MDEVLELSGSADGMLEWSAGAGREPAGVVESADGRTGGGRQQSIVNVEGGVADGAVGMVGMGGAVMRDGDEKVRAGCGNCGRGGRCHGMCWVAGVAGGNFDASAWLISDSEDPPFRLFPRCRFQMTTLPCFVLCS